VCVAQGEARNREGSWEGNRRICFFYAGASVDDEGFVRGRLSVFWKSKRQALLLIAWEKGKARLRERAPGTVAVQSKWGGCTTGAAYLLLQAAKRRGGHRRRGKRASSPLR